MGDRYELVRKVGAGGFGSVYEAIDRDLERVVAVKVLDLGDRDLALQEGQALARLSHTNVVTIHDHGFGPDFRYLVLELLEGPDLRTWWRDKSTADILAKFMEAGRGLGAAHAVGLVHRDFKPSNVRIGSKGQAVVVDFGLARQVEALGSNEDERGVFVGTVEYGAPERLIGEPGNERSDQFSFCVALWDALSGVNPFGACTAATSNEDRVRAILAGAVGAPRGGRRVERALRRGLSPNPANRFPSMDSLMAAIAPEPRRWAWQELLVGGVAVVLLAGVLTQLMPTRAGGRPEFVHSVQAAWSGHVAVVAAQQGNADMALRHLEAAKRTKISNGSSRELAVLSEEVARELGQRLMYWDAATAWQLAILFARDAQDTNLEQRARKGLNAVYRAAKSAPR
ncbi:Serine/threonine kinase PKN8 [Enhygromyxa salina]|uniref:Serine/threonine kinase PKN8 n=1 Tax=Enhygromyxa salina TaxID=215803 RepID=A0A0C2CK36_9BACT|nr:Serine/threonine kinase PKN8 [Enhygromyxa salina]